MKLNVDKFIENEIEKRLKRKMNELERHIFSAMWSEHCGYLHSKLQLNKLNFKGALFHQENAGGVKIGNLGVFFKTESHNHPCAVEPYQGAATGIGGIIRDILALNARPIALLNSLKFCAEQKHLIDGVTRGISDYGNSCGIANVGGEVIFDECYRDLPLVNVMAVGVVPVDKVKLSSAKENLEIVILGSATGLDGVGGAAFASKELKKDTKEEKIHVQIGDPFAKKKLIEACIEILNVDGVIACQDCGAAGLLSSTSEMAYKGGCSIELDLDKIHLATENMSAAQILLSETQERMVFAVEKNVLDKIFEIAQKFELDISCIGKTFSGNNYIIKKGGEILSSTPLDVICEPYFYNLEPVVEPKINACECRENMKLECALKKLVSCKEFASKKWFFEQWDYAVGGRTYMQPDISGAAAVKIENGFIGLCMDSKPRFVELNPYLGAKSTFLESCRNLISSGFEPMGFTNCLNFASPKNDYTKYAFVRSIEGLCDISKDFSVPVVSGNVSFYNEKDNRRIYPTVTIGMLGYCENEQNLTSAIFQKDEEVFLLGKKITLESNVGASLYQSVLFNCLCGKLDEIDVDLELKLKNAILDMINKKIISGASDVSKGGILGALLEVLFRSDIGFCGSLLPKNILEDWQKLKLLFGEIEGRYIVSCVDFEKMKNYLVKNNIPHCHLGKCVGDKIEFDGYSFNLDELRKDYNNSIKNALEQF